MKKITSIIRSKLRLGAIYNKVLSKYNRLLSSYYQRKKKISVRSFEDTIDEILKRERSVIRFGDGEMTIMSGRGIGFQKSCEGLAQDLKNIIKYKSGNIFICIPGMIANDTNELTSKAKKWWKDYRNTQFYKWQAYLSPEVTYGEALISRFYVGIEDKNFSALLIGKIKKIWENKKLLIVEGEFTRNGVGNDLFATAKSVSRVICPAENAYDKHKEIVKYVASIADSYDEILVTLGPTAKVVVYELAKLNIRAIDLGHLDNEYEWFLADKGVRVDIPGKYVNEISGGNAVSNENIDPKYWEEIIYQIK